MEIKTTTDYQEKKQHGSRLFPFNIYPCTIPLDFPVVPLHWHKEMELIYIKKAEDRSSLKQITMKAEQEISLWCLQEHFIPFTN